MPSLHMSRPSFWPQSYQQPEGLGRLSIPLSSWIYRKFSNSLDDKRIAKVMKMSNHEDVILEEDDGDYERGDIFLNFHHQALRPISRKALLASFLSAWLKRCIIPSRPHDDIMPLLIFLTVQLVYKRSLELLPVKICHIQSGLRASMEQFYAKVIIKRTRKELIFPHDGPSPRVEWSSGKPAL